MLDKLRKIPVPLLLLCIGALLFFPNLGEVHLFDWDEINFAESAREMLVTGNYWQVQIDYQPFWEKPPFFIWLQALSMKFFGVNEFAARFPNAVCGLVSMLVLYLIGKRLYDKSFGVMWVMAYVGSLLPHFYFKSGIIDPWFNLFIFLGLYFITHIAQDEEFLSKKVARKLRFRYVVLSGFFTGLAVLTKGPVAILLVSLAVLVVYIWNRFRKVFSIPDLLLWSFVLMVVTFFWYGFETIENGPFFLKKFIAYQIRLFQTEDAGHGGPFYYHFVVLLFGCFPASIFALKGGFIKGGEEPRQLDFKKWMVSLLVVVLLVFSAVQTKILHYSSLAYFPITYLAALTIWSWSKEKNSFPIGLRIFSLFLLFIWAIAAAALPILASDTSKLLSWVSEKDLYTRAALQMDVPWRRWEMIYGILFALGGIAAFILWSFKRRYLGSFILFAVVALFVQVLLYAFAPRIERYTQGPAIEFYEHFQDSDTEVRVLGFKSYAHLFYTQKPPGLNEQMISDESYLMGDLEKPVYFVSKVDRVQQFQGYTDLEELYRKGGFVFLVRRP